MERIRDFVNTLNPFAQAGEDSQEAGLPQWRERILDSLVAGVLIWGLVALIPGLWLSISLGSWDIAFIDFFAYAVSLLFFLYRKKIPYTLRANILLLVSFVLSTFIFIITGDEGTDLFWNFVIPPLASLLLGLGPGFAFFALNFAFLSVIGMLIALGIEISPRVSDFTLTSWMVYNINFLAANAIITFPLGALLEGLFRSAEAQRKRVEELKAIGKLSEDMRTATTLDAMLPPLLDTAIEFVDGRGGSIWLFNEKDGFLEMKASRGYISLAGREGSLPRQKPGTGLAGMIFEANEPIKSREYKTDPRIPEEYRSQMSPGVGGVSLPIRAENKIIGVLDVNVLLPRELNPNEVKLLLTFSEIAGNAIQRNVLHEKTERQLKQVKALNEIDKVILSSFDLHFNLKVLLTNIMDQLGVDAVNIMLYDAGAGVLTSLAGQGFRTLNIQGSRVSLGESLAGSAAATRHVVRVDDITTGQVDSRLASAFQEEGITSYLAHPLIAKGELRGVLEIFNRQPIPTSEEWLSLVDAMAGRTAIAIDSSKVFESLQQSNRELTLSYDATIEGWSRALDLRDRETEGHSQRVAELAVGLGEAMGVSGPDLVNIFRGGLLHDIGKMGVPDQILRKPGKLTEDEWRIMKTHPSMARDLLDNINFLKNALDIPFSHHEKWDGSGYPRGISGEQIPLAARIFAVADVFDALISERPYRGAWTEEAAIAYIKDQAGKHFDPKVVEIFLAQIQTKN